MIFHVLSIFPDMFDLFREYGIIRRAIEQNKISVSAINIRDFAEGKHRATDDRPYGGGCGMVMKPEPLARAIRYAKSLSPVSSTVFLSPQGIKFKQHTASEFASLKGLIFVCGRYEGVDERICDDLIDYEVSIGDYILTGGELPAMILMDAITRLIPGVLGGDESAQKDSFSDYFLEHAHYTRPRIFEGESVPDLLLSGNHAEIKKWRFETSIIRTFLKRKDLLCNKKLNKQEIEILKKWYSDIEKIISVQSVYGADTLPCD